MSKESDAYLAHYGVPGMRWGKHLKSAGSGVASSVRAGARAVAEANGDAAINRARENAPKVEAKYREAKTEYKTAKKAQKTKYQQDKVTMGRAQAKAALQKVGKTKLIEARTELINNNRVANQDTSTEAMAKMVQAAFAQPTAYSQLQANRRSGYTNSQR